MSYYNPLNSQDSYYNPTSNQQQTSTAEVVSGAIKNLVTVGALNVVGGIASKYIGAKFKNTIKSWSQNNKSIYRKNIANKIVKSATDVNKAIAPIKASLRKSSIAKAGAARKIALQKTAGTPGHGLARVTSAFKNPKTLLATAAGTWKKNVLSGMGVAYAVDSTLGFTKDIGLEKKSWYDAPGKISNFGKWLVNDSIYGTAMGAAGPVIGAIGSIGTKAAGKAFGGSFGKKILNFASKFSPGIPTDKRYDGFFDKKVLANVRSQQEKKFGSDAVKKGLHGLTSSVSDTYRQMENSFHTTSDSVKSTFKDASLTFGDRTRKSLDTISSALKNVRSIELKAKKQIARPSSTSGLEAFSALSRLAQKVSSYKGEGPSLENFKQTFIPSILKHNRSKAGLGKIFGFLDEVKVKDVVNKKHIDEVYSQLSSKYAKEDVEQVMQPFLNMRAGTNVYKGWKGSNIKGGGVDLSAFDPINVMRRGASAIANKQFNIPFSQSKMSLGDITGVTKFLAEKPSFLFFDKAPAFKIDGSPNLKSTLDMAPMGDEQFMYMNGKYASFNGATINTVDSKRTLYLSQKSSKDKSLELKQIKVDKIKAVSAGVDPANTMAWYNKVKDRVDNQSVPTDRYLQILDRANLGIPAKLEDMALTMVSKLTGKKDYKAKVGNFFNDAIETSHRNLPYIDNIYQHTSQAFSKILQHDGAVQEMARYSLHKHLQGDFVEALYDDQLLVHRLMDAFDTGKTRGVATGKDTVRAVKFMKAFPSEAKNHETIKRLGPLSSMSARDVARKNYVEDVFNKQFLDNQDPNAIHPLVGMSEDLLQKKIITKNEAKALKLHAKLSVFKDESLRLNINTGEDLKGLMGTMRRRFGSELNETHNEMIDFVSNYDMRSVKVKNSQASILPKEVFVSDDNPFTSIGVGPLGIFKNLTETSLDSVTGMIGDYLPFKKRYLQHHGFEGNLKYIGGALGTTAAVFGAYRIVDTVIASNPMFDNTMFDEGVTGVGADTLAKIRFGTARVADVTGVTATMKYLHGLAPKSETSIPGAIAGGIVGFAMSKSPWGTIKSVAGGAILNRMASPYLPDLTKSHEELVEIYSGREEVPIMKSPTWLLGGTPWEGSKVEAWSPNWYVRAKSRWKETDNVYGSAVRRLIHEPLPLLGFNVGDLIDPYYMERKHFFTRPYPISGGTFDEVPVIGKALSATIGRIIKPEKTMHSEFLERDQISSDVEGNPYPFAVRPPTLVEGKMLMRTPGRVRSMGGITNNQGVISDQPNKYWGERASEDVLNDLQNFSGLKGFLTGSIAGKIFGESKVLPTLESAGRMASFSRSYHDLNLGGMGMITEPLRRLIDKPDYKQYGVNPIPNMMPNWLPSHLMTGDPYEKILRGELRLPGEAYLKTHTDVTRSMPARASMLGGNKENIVQYFTGLLSPLQKEEFDILEKGTKFHELIQQNLAAEGLLVQAEAMVVDVKNDISGHVDAVIRDGKGGKGKRALEIKTINDHGFQKLSGPKYEHVGQLNFYLRQLKMQKGSILYINRDNPSEVKTFELNYSQSRWEKDLQKLKKARAVAATMMTEGVSDTRGYSYSWLDRLDILADVAPTSKEYKEAKYIVQKQIKGGALTTDEGEKYKKILHKRQARIRKYELYPNRFKGKLFNPDTENDIQSINDDIKAGAEYSAPERAVGWLWENFTNTNTFLVNKFFAMKDPLEHYKMTRIYGKEYKPWDEPIRSWAEPMARGMASKSNPLGGGISFGIAGKLLGGGVGTVIGAGFGTAYGSLHGLYRFATGSKYIPGSVQDKREIVSFFDAAKYEKNNMLAQLSGGLTRQQFMSNRDATLTAFNNYEGATVANLFRGTSFMEKPYIEPFLQENDPKKREEILAYVPKDLAMALKRQWNKDDQRENTDAYVQSSSNELASNRKQYNFNESIFDPAVNLDDIELSVIENQGMDAHEFGLGWNEQMLRIQESQNQITSSSIAELQANKEMAGPNISSAHVRGVINDLFNRHGIKAYSQVYINNSDQNNNIINLIVKRDRSRAIVDSLYKRNKYRV